MTMLKVTLLTSLKESSGAILAGGSKVYPKGAVLNGTLDTLPKAVADAIKGKESYVSVVEVQTDILPEDDSLPTPEVVAPMDDDLDEIEGESTSPDETSSEDNPDDNLKDKIEKANRKLQPKE